MPAVPDYQRARRPEQKEERRESILAAARELAGERAVREISLGDIARRVGFSKANVLRYFESREHVFLQLLLREWDAWTTHAELKLRARRPSAATLANTIAYTLAERPVFCDLVSEMSAVLERNVSVATVQAFKAETLMLVDHLGEVVAERFPKLARPRARETVAAALIMTAGLWPIANPTSRVSAMYSEIPELMRAHVDFEQRLEQLLKTLITGFLHTSTTNHRRTVLS
ncbi:MAG TPA: TetR family transcriptional regulator [Solirubrobacteraceae bacterium]